MSKKLILIATTLVVVIALSKKMFFENSHNNSEKISYDPAKTKFLEDAAGQQALEWSRSHTKKAKDYIKNQPLYAGIKKNMEKIYYDKNRRLMGRIRDGYVYNFWDDEKNPLGLWRRTTIAEYAKDLPKWEMLIDFDELSKQMG